LDYFNIGRGRNTIIRIKSIFIITIFLLPQFAFSDNSDDENKFSTIDLSISPNTDGFLDGRASIELNWLPFLQSGLSFISDGYVQAVSEGNDDYTTI